MQNGPIIEYYESIARTSAKMLHAARRGDWEALLEGEKTCAGIIDVIRNCAADQSVESVEHVRKAELIRQMLADDAEIRDLMHPWMKRLELLLHHGSVSRTAERAYRESER